MKKFVSAYGKALSEAPGDLKTNVKILRDVCSAIGLTYDTLHKGDITLTSMVVLDYKNEDHYTITVNHYLYGSINQKEYTFEKEPSQECTKAFTNVFGEYSIPIETNCGTDENGVFDVARLIIRQGSGFLQAAEYNLRLLCREDSGNEKFKSELKFLSEVSKEYFAK